MERVINFEPGYDKRSSDPSKNYGVGAMKIRFILKGDKGAVQLLLGTNWLPDTIQEEYWRKDRKFFDLQPIAWDLGYHSPTQMYDGQSSFEKCEYLDGKTCYYDGSTLNAEPIRAKFMLEGESAVWEALAEYYNEKFGSADD